MIRKYVLIIGTICLHYNICISQENRQHNEKFLIILDIQSVFYHNTMLDSSAKEMIKNVNILIDQFASKKVIYIKAGQKALSISRKGFKVKSVVPDLDSNLKIVNHSIITKFSGNAFATAGLINLLENNGAKDIILVGLLAEKCIYQTALGGIDNKYNIYIIPEAIIGKTTKKKNNAIKKMKEKGIIILPVNEILN